MIGTNTNANKISTFGTVFLNEQDAEKKFLLIQATNSINELQSGKNKKHIDKFSRDTIKFKVVYECLSLNAKKRVKKKSKHFAIIGKFCHLKFS